MIPSIAEIKHNITAAANFMRFNDRGLGMFEVSDNSFWKSFFAAVICLPGIYFLSVSRGSGTESTLEPVAFFVICSLFYLIEWVAFPVVMHAILVLHNKEKHFRLFVISYNWIQVCYVVFSVVLYLLKKSEILPETTADFLGIISTFYILGTLAFLIKSTIETRWLIACSFVFLYILLSISVYQLNEQMLAL